MAVELYQRSLKLFEELRDMSNIANALAQLGKIHENKDKDFLAALEKYLYALSIDVTLHIGHGQEFLEEDLIHSVEKKLNEYNIITGYIFRLKDKMGEIAFKKAMEEITRRHGA